MASIWIATKGVKEPVKTVNLTMAGAKEMLGILRGAFNMKKGCKAKVISGLEWHGFNNGEVVNHVWIEPCSPPSKPTGGDIYRNASAKGA